MGIHVDLLKEICKDYETRLNRVDKEVHNVVEMKMKRGLVNAADRVSLTIIVKVNDRTIFADVSWQESDFDHHEDELAKRIIFDMCAYGIRASDLALTNFFDESKLK